MPNEQMQVLAKHVSFETWEPIDDSHTLCRFVTSWATTASDLEALREGVREMRIKSEEWGVKNGE